jgi:pimeloyl-ACP methyl ester carboxylesterase
MANIVLVHGAWHGGWCYRDTAKALRDMGHHVFTPTHTGVGDRFHQSNEAITLETHVRDVAGLIEAEELNDVVLCGHSYGGMVITCVADRMADRIKSLVYIDAYVPEHEQSLIDILKISLPAEVSPVFINSFRGSSLAGNSNLMVPIPAEMFNIKLENRAWVDRRCRAQPLATFECPALLTGAVNNIKHKHYLLADGWDPSPFRYFAAKLTGQPGWTVSKLASSHDIMVDMPHELAKAVVAAC